LKGGEEFILPGTKINSILHSTLGRRGSLHFARTTDSHSVKMSLEGKLAKIKSPNLQSQQHVSLFIRESELA
jgi:hypothetical protein